MSLNADICTFWTVLVLVIALLPIILLMKTPESLLHLLGFDRILLPFHILHDTVSIEGLGALDVLLRILVAF
jgi:hypothetical protein